jgi:hypothetical protein
MKLSLLLVLFSALYVSALETPYDRRGVPDWAVDVKHPKDAFTFVRIKYNSWS